MSNELVSIIVPVYKCGDFIGHCIDSLTTQTYRNIEIILVLDGEFDESGDICRAAARQDKRVYVIEKENEGVSVARNRGIEASHGKWITFVDSDDWLEPEFISEMLEQSEKEKPDILICDFYTDYKDKTEKSNFFSFTDHCFKKQEIHELLVSCLVHTEMANKSCPTNVGVPWAKFYRKDFIEKNQLKFVRGLKRMQDTVFNLNAFLCAKNIIYKSLPLYHYTKNDNGVTTAYTPDFDRIAIMFINEVQKFIDKNNLLELQEPLYEKTFILIMELMRLQYVSEKCPLSTTEKIRELKCIIYKKPFITSIRYQRSIYLTRNQKIAMTLLKLHLIGIVFKWTEWKTKRRYRNIIKMY